MEGKLREIIVTLLKGGPDREGGIGRKSKNTVIFLQVILDLNLNMLRKFMLI